MGFPFALNHIPNFVLCIVLSGVELLLEVDSIVILGDMIDHRLVAHALEDCTAAYSTPAKHHVSFCLLGLSEILTHLLVAEFQCS